MPQAERDLDDIFDYINYELQNPTAAENMIDEISNALIGLEDMPKKYPHSQIPELKALGIRKVVVKKYIALYLIDEEAKTATVVTVFYGARDCKNISFDLF
jgi:addiction module RelE/StbE family toxin